MGISAYAVCMDRLHAARETIWTAIREAGGPYHVAREAKIDVGQLYLWRRRVQSFGEDRLARLRAQLPDIDDATWGAALVPQVDP